MSHFKTNREKKNAKCSQNITPLCEKSLDRVLPVEVLYKNLKTKILK